MKSLTGMRTETTREAFLEWACGDEFHKRWSGFDDDDVKFCSVGSPREGEYRNTLLQQLWEAWSASQQHDIGKCESRCADLKIHISTLESERDALKTQVAKYKEWERQAMTVNNPENDLFSDAMDAAISMHHSVLHGARRNAERGGEQMDGEKIARRALAAGIVAYLEESGFTVIKDSTP